MRIKAHRFSFVILTVFSLAGCGGVSSGDNLDGSAKVTNKQSLVLSGWYSCNVDNVGSVLAKTPSSGEILATPHGALYGSCVTASGAAASVNVSASYAGTSGVMPDFNNVLVLQATLSNLLFYPIINAKPATNGVGTPLPPDSYASASPDQSFNTNFGDAVNFEFLETGSASQSGAPNTFTVPKTFYLANSTTYLKPQSGAPATSGDFEGSYVTATSYAWDGTLNATVQQTLPGVIGPGSALTIDSAGNLSGITSAGTLSGTITAYDASTGTAEYTGTLTTTSGTVPVQGAYASAAFSLATYALTAGGAVDPSTEKGYTPLALFIKGNGFLYEALLQKAS